MTKILQITVTRLSQGGNGLSQGAIFNLFAGLRQHGRIPSCSASSGIILIIDSLEQKLPQAFQGVSTSITWKQKQSKSLPNGGNRPNASFASGGRAEVGARAGW